MARKRQKRVQSSRTVVVGASEPVQQQVEPIRRRQDHQASESTPIFKTEKQNHEVDDHINEINNSNLNTVSCQGNVYKTVMTDGCFYEQYVYEMKQTQGPSLMVCVVQEPNDSDEHSETNESLTDFNYKVASMQSFNYLLSAMRHVFKYLRVHELLIASRVCIAWNMIASDRHLWHTVRLKNSLVRDWEKSIKTICRQNSVVLDTRRMLIPAKVEETEHFWSKFILALTNAKSLKCIELYRCPVSVVEGAIYSLPQLTVLNATSLKNPNSLKNPLDLMRLNLNSLDQMVQLTELKLKGMTGIKLTNIPSFKKLVNLKTLALTSIKAFPIDINHIFKTVTTNLVSLEIGDCECLNVEFAMILKRFTNLTSLRLENCFSRWNSIAEKVFDIICGLKKLRILELVNIVFSDDVVKGLEQLDGIEALLVIPAHISECPTANCHLIGCLKKLSKTLTHFIWGTTDELLPVTDLYIEKYCNSIPIPKSRKKRSRSGKNLTFLEREGGTKNSHKFVEIPALENVLQKIMEHAKIEIVKVSVVTATRVYLVEHFNDLKMI